MMIPPVSERQVRPCEDYGKHSCVFFVGDDCGVYCTLHPEYRVMDGMNSINRPDKCPDNFTREEMLEFIAEPGA